MTDEDQIRSLLQRAADSIPYDQPPVSDLIARERQRSHGRLLAGTTIATMGAIAAVATGIAVTSPEHHTVPAVSAVAPRNGPTAQAMDDAPAPVVATMREDAVLKQYYPDVATMITASDLDAAVQGTVTKIRYESAENNPMTVLTIDVKRNLIGTTPGSITVHEDGGFLPAAAMIAELQEKPHAKAAIDPDGVVDVRFEGADHLQRGDDVILFLVNDPNKGREGDYMEFGSVYGRFKLVSGGTYARAGNEPEMAATTTLATLTALIAGAR